MAKIFPFRGLRYPHKQCNDLLAPPYDVVDEADTARLKAKSPHNIAHLILTDKNNPGVYAEIAHNLHEWLAEGVLKEDDAPSLYVLRQTFADHQQDGTTQTVTRWGLTCCVGLEPYENRVVLPHEKTLSGPKADRLKLMEATQTNFSQVMGLYEGGAALSADYHRIAQQEPDATYDDGQGVDNALWRVTDPAFIQKATALLADKPVLIADGHHRYETSLQYKQVMMNTPAANAASQMTFTLIDGQDEGVVVYPIHRWVTTDVLTNAPGWQDRLGDWFEVETLSALPADAHRALRGSEHQSGDATFLFLQPGQSPLRLTLRPEKVAALQSVPENLKRLDTALLQGALFHEVLGLSAEDIAQEKGVGYLKDFTALNGLVNRPGVGAVILCRPTPLPLVMELARAGVVLPQKSTFFYPKLPSGMTMRSIQ